MRMRETRKNTTRPAWPFLLAATLCLQAVAPGERLLFLDEQKVPEFSGIERRLHAPVPKEVVLKFDEPWEGLQSGYATVLKSNDEYRMYYRGGGDLSREVTCVAFSKDGIHWNKPQLATHEFEGNTSNNIILMPKTPSYVESHNFFPFLDSVPDVPPGQRWKGVALYYWREGDEARRTLGTWVSGDGLNWQPLSEGAAIDRGGGFDSLNVAFRDPWKGDFAIFSRTGQEGYRHIQLTSTVDFTSFSESVPLKFGEPPNTHFYTNAITPVPALRDDDDFPYYVGMPMRFIPERKSALGRDTDGVSDAVLITSRDRVNWTWVSHEAWIRPGMQQSNWGNAHGNMTPVQGILATSQHEWSVYWMENYGGDAPQVRRGSMRPEGFASLHAGAETGKATVGPITSGKRQLLLNASTSAAGSIRVAVLRENGETHEGFSLEDCKPIWGDDLFLPVEWKSAALLPDHSEENIHLQFELRDADLYAVRLIGN